MNINAFMETIDVVWNDLSNAILDDTQKLSQQASELINHFHNMTDELFGAEEYRKSTGHIGTLINLAVSFLNDHECYLNIGVWKGYTLFAGALGNLNRLCVGVDHFDPDYLLSMDPRYDARKVKDAFSQVRRKLNMENVQIFEMDYKDFLSQFTLHVPKKIGAFFYDADHSIEATLRALRMARPHFSDSCLVILDDYNTPSVSSAVGIWLSENLDFQISLELPTPGRGHPTWWNGVVLLTKLGDFSCFT